MPVGLVTDEDFKREIDSYSPKTPVVTGEIIDIPKKGRKEGDVNVPDSLRKIIGEEALFNGRESAVSLAQEFGLSPSSASAYAVGSTSTSSYNEPKQSIVSYINKSRERAMKRASKTLNAALGSITKEKLDYTDADKLSGIAKDMSVIIKNLEPKSESVDVKQAPQFTIYAPQFRDERSYELIRVQE